MVHQTLEEMFRGYWQLVQLLLRIEKYRRYYHHGSYKEYSPAQHLEIGRYCWENEAAAAARHFSRKFGFEINESTIKSIKTAYLKEVKKRPRGGEDAVMTSLPQKKRGRKLLVGGDVDSKIQLYLGKVREAGGSISARIVMAAG